MSIPKNNEEISLDSALRPREWNQYIGQERVKKNLRILIDAAKKRGEPIDHILLYGPPGLGKTTLAQIIGLDMTSSVKTTSGPAIEKVGDLASILTNMEDGDILFIDEAHRLHRSIEEILYPAMENNVLDIIIGKGPSAKTLQLQLPRFTIIAATTKIGMISPPLRSRFGAIFQLDLYSKDDIKNILQRSANMLGVKIENGALETLAQASRSTPRTANRLLKRIRDYSQVHNSDVVTENIAKSALQLLGIDHLGLEAPDIKILETIIKKYNGGPVGLKTITASTMEEADAVEDIYEPYLLHLGFIARTPKGRQATEHAYKHLGLNFSKESDKLQKLI